MQEMGRLQEMDRPQAHDGTHQERREKAKDDQCVLNTSCIRILFEYNLRTLAILSLAGVHGA
jgi:hypothetical protein